MFDLEKDIISSRQNPIVVNTMKLEDRKWREEAFLFRCDGIKLLEEAIKRQVDIAYLLVAQGALDHIRRFIENKVSWEAMKKTVKTYVIADTLFEKISQEKSPEGVIIVGKYIDKFHKITTINNNIFLMKDKMGLLLESVRDPQNVGTILRTARGLGVDYAVLGKDCADIYHPKTIRATMGTMFDMPIVRVDSIANAIANLQKGGRRVFATALDKNAMPLSSFKAQKGDCLVMGNEGHGLTQATIDACDGTIYIPMMNGVESLNVAAAAAVMLWHFTSQIS